ncbi:MAG: 50S ribosomal protein L25 [Spirochaetales bacterium]|nr:50S ribosomal protein L25 [Spirochaetales bacterium]
MEMKELSAVIRKDLKKGPTKKVRSEGKIPAVIYGHAEPVAIAVDEVVFNKSFTDIQANTIFTIDVEGTNRDVLVKDIQENILTSKILHIDFFEIEKGKALRTTVPVKLVGVAPGIKAGGALEERLHVIDIECIPSMIPSAIEIDISNLQLNEAIHVSDIVIDEEVKILSNPEQTIVSLSIIKVVEEATDEDADEEIAVEGEAAAEPAGE